MMEAFDKMDLKYDEKLSNMKEKVEEKNNLKQKIDEEVKENSLRVDIKSLIDEVYFSNKKGAEVFLTLQWPTAIESSLHQLEDALKITEHDEISTTVDSLSSSEAVRLTSLQSFGRMGHGFGEMASPRAITISKDGNLYCTDWENNKIFNFTPFGELIHVITDVKQPYSYTKY